MEDTDYYKFKKPFKWKSKYIEVGKVEKHITVEIEREEKITNEKLQLEDTDYYKFKKPFKWKSKYIEVGKVEKHITIEIEREKREKND